MIAVFESGGKQYKVEKGSIIDIELVDGEQGTEVLFDKVLLFSDKGKSSIGTPYLEGAVVKATILSEFRDKKKIVFKFKRKTGYQLKQGHRQSLNTIKIESINLKSKTKKSSETK